MSEVYATVVKTKYEGGAWLVSMWDSDSDTDHYTAFVSRVAAERWLDYLLGSLPKREWVNTNHYYYEWPEGTP